MKGPRELKRYVATARRWLKAAHWDDLLIFKLQRCRKWRKKHRAPRDGYGNRPRESSDATLL